MNSKQQSSSSPDTISLFRWALGATLLALGCAFLPAGTFVLSKGNFLPLHVLAETFSVVVGMMVFSLIWEQRNHPSRSEFLLASAFLSSALLDVGHMMSYSGMPDFVSPSGPDKSIQFWLAARIIAAAALLAYGAGFPARQCLMPRCRYMALGMALSLSGVVFWICVWYGDLLPAVYVPGQGLTHFKVGVEYFVMALNGMAAVLLFRRWRQTGAPALVCMAMAAWVMLLGELFFTRYLLVTDLVNLIGHGYKVTAYALIYGALVRKLVQEPYLMAEREAFRSRAVIDTSTDGIHVVSADARIVEANAAFANQLGYQVDEVLGQPIAAFDAVLSSEEIEKMLEDVAQEPRIFETRHRCKDGRLLPVEVSVSLFSGDEAPLYVAVARDISDRREMEELRLARTVFETADSGIMVTDAHEHILDINPAFTRITGYEREEVIGQTPRVLKSGRHEESFYASMWDELKSNGQWQGEVHNVRKNGSEYVAQLIISSVPGNKKGQINFVAQFADITALKSNQQQLSRLAHFDALTQLPNRVLLADRLTQAMALNRRNNTQLGVCYMDLDGFKAVNDSLGHQAGDHLLVEVARRLERNLRAGDTAARLGGDEFAVLLSDLHDDEECGHAMRRLLATMAAPYVIDGNTCDGITASVGVTLFPHDSSDADTLLRHADQAMYAAKKAGKNCYRLFDANLEQRMEARMDTLRRVARGLARGQFMLYYQPKVDCQQHKVKGLEALIRWEHPVLGMLSPDSFLPVVEEDEVALVMGEWVLREALRQMRVWHEAGTLVPVSINAFALQLSNRRFPRILRQAIEEVWPELPEGVLEIEIVETSALKELEVIEQIISECRALGVHFSLDDFGTGYSSLVYLRRLSVNELKIDQSFVRDMLNDEQDFQIVDGIVSLGRGFRLRVVAEGVESKEQVRALRELGCDVMQGYHFARPMPADQVPAWVAAYGESEATIEEEAA